MSRIVRTLEALQDAIDRVPKIGSAGAIYEKELLAVLSDALNTIKWLTDEGPAITEPKPGVSYEYGVQRTDKNAAPEPAPQVSEETAKRTIQRQQMPHAHTGSRARSSCAVSSQNGRKSITDHQQAAIEAGARAYDPEAWTAYDRESPSTEGRELMVEYSKSKAESILAAAEPHLRRKWAEEEASKLAKTTVGLAAILDRIPTNKASR